MIHLAILMKNGEAIFVEDAKEVHTYVDLRQDPEFRIDESGNVRKPRNRYRPEPAPTVYPESAEVCPSCTAVYERTHKACPHCGFRLESEPRLQNAAKRRMQADPVSIYFAYCFDLIRRFWKA